MAHEISKLRRPTRREFLWQAGGGLGGIALAAMLGEEDARAQGRGLAVRALAENKRPEASTPATSASSRSAM